MSSVAVMGAGSWGSAFASICADAGQEVRLWARREEVAESISETHTNPDYLGDIELNPAVTATTDAEHALDGADIAVLAVPSHALADALAGWTGLVKPGAVAVSLIKGVRTDTLQRGSQIIRELWDLPSGNVVVLSGPNLARECAQRLPGATVVAGPDSEVTAQVQAACHTPAFRVYTNPDLIGVEIGGAVKNPLAIAAGMADGLGFGDNTKASLVTRGLAEMSRLGLAVGGNPLTFSGLAGVGDLMATCTSRQSRNRGVGERLGRGESLDAIIADMRMVAEGVKSGPAILALAEQAGVEMPIVAQVVRVLRDGADPGRMAAALMGRRPRAEFHSFDEKVAKP